MTVVWATLAVLSGAMAAVHFAWLVSAMTGYDDRVKQHGRRSADGAISIQALGAVAMALLSAWSWLRV